MCKKKNLSWVLGTDQQISPSGHSWASLGGALWCQTVTLGTDFSISTSHPWKILIFGPGHYLCATRSCFSCPRYFFWKIESWNCFSKKSSSPPPPPPPPPPIKINWSLPKRHANVLSIPSANTAGTREEALYEWWFIICGSLGTHSSAWLRRPLHSRLPIWTPWLMDTLVFSYISYSSISFNTVFTQSNIAKEEEKVRYELSPFFSLRQLVRPIWEASAFVARPARFHWPEWTCQLSKKIRWNTHAFFDYNL